MLSQILHNSANASNEIVSNWWVFTYAGMEPVQIALWPPANHAEVLALNPKAISAMPIQSPLAQTVALLTPQVLLDLMRVGGYSVSVDGTDLLISQAKCIDSEMADLIKVHKAGLIKILQSEIQP